MNGYQMLYQILNASLYISFSFYIQEFVTIPKKQLQNHNYNQPPYALPLVPQVISYITGTPLEYSHCWRLKDRLTLQYIGKGLTYITKVK